MPSYGYMTWLEAQQAVSLRLNDAAQVRWIKSEVEMYLSEALRMWNVLTQEWLADWTTTYLQPNPATLPIWQSTGNAENAFVGSNPSSPRTQTLTDVDVYTLMQYHLLEPATGNGTWSGSTQFTLDDFTQAFARRRDEILQKTGCFVGQYASSVELQPGTNRLALPSSASQIVLDLLRIRFVPSQGSASTLWREDGMAFEYFTNGYEQTVGTPQAWDVIGSPPQTVTFNASPNQPNSLEILAMLSGSPVNPPTDSPLLMPDDWSWGLKYGMMADLLGKNYESADPLRAKYCVQRFQEFLKLAVSMPWLTQARINGVPVDTPSIAEADLYSWEWEANPSALAQVVRGATDLFAVCPVIPAGGSTSVQLTMVGNAPIPASDTDFVQAAPDVVDAMIDYAQHIAMFKDGGSSLEQSMPLYENFIRQAASNNSRLQESGIFPNVLRPKVSREDEAEPRYSQEN